MKIVSAKDGFVLPAYHALARRQRKGGVIVVQEIFGVTHHIRDIANRFAERGYEALAPAFFERAAPGFEANGAISEEDRAKGIACAQKTPPDQIASDMQAAIDSLSGPVFVTGFCWGGAMSWLAAARCRNVEGASGFYGRLINSMLDLQPKTPIILHFGERDKSIPPAAVAEVCAAFPAIPVYKYDAGHGFCRDDSHDFNAIARDLALTRTFDFFDAIAGGKR